MKKLIIMFSYLLPLLSFAASHNLNAFQELCAKEKDPVKRQNYCHLLDQTNREQANIEIFYRESFVG